jgi:transcriptional regulator with XRE-family HTH domain
MGELETKFGELLKLERERQGIPLEDLSTELKISEDSLTSIEKGDAGALPSELYYKLFSKSYAERLGIDYGKTMDAIREEIGISLEPEPKTGAARKEGEADKAKHAEKAPADEEDGEPGDEKKFIKRVIYISAAIVVVFCLVLIGYKFILGRGDDSAGGVPSGSDMGEARTAAEAEGIKAEFADYQWGVPENAEPDSLLVTLTARDQSWATVVADGDTVLYQNLRPWREYDVRAAYRILVSIGIPRLVEIKLDGEPVDLVDPNSGRISRVEINQANRMTFEPPEEEPSRPARQPAATPAEPEHSEAAQPEVTPPPEATSVEEPAPVGDTIQNVPEADTETVTPDSL